MVEAGKSSFSDRDLKIAACLALDFTVERTADVVESSISTVKRTKGDSNVARVEAIFRTVLAQSEAKQAESASKSASERISTIVDDGLAVVERAVARAKAKGDEIELREVLAVKKAVTDFLEYQMSKAPKRVQVDGSHTHTNIHAVLSAEDVKTLMESVRITQAATKGLIGGDADVIDVDAN